MVEGRGCNFKSGDRCRNRVNNRGEKSFVDEQCFARYHASHLASLTFWSDLSDMDSCENRVGRSFAFPPFLR